MTRDSGSRGNLPIPLIGGVLLTLLLAGCYAFIWTICMQHTEGHFTYALDDPYIHLAIAKNIAYHGVWGVTQYAPASASSSPLWSLLLAASMVAAGKSVFGPLVFGILASLATMILLYVRFIRAGVLMPVALAACALIFVAGPLEILPFTGMEHSLQILLDLLFGFWLLDTMARPSETPDLRMAVVLTTLVCLCRYESAFLVIVPFGVSVWRRDWRLASALAVGPILAVGGFGLFSHLNGMPWVPNSILLKGNVPKTSMGSFLVSLAKKMLFGLRSESLPLWDLFLIALAAGLVLRIRGLREKTVSLQIWIWAVLLACVLHAGLAMIGYFYRYEAYLLVSLGTVIVLAVREILAHSWPVEDMPMTRAQWLLWVGAFSVVQIVLSSLFWFYQLRLNLIVCLFGLGLVALASMDFGVRTKGRFGRVLMKIWLPLALILLAQDRATTAVVEIPKACQDIYLQQWQMARFVSRYYPTGRLGANDIGAVTYFSDVHLLDLVGLASDSVRRLRLKRTYGTQTLGKEIDAFKPDLIIAYPDWFVGSNTLPSSLIQVAHWTIPPVTSAACQKVTFYVTSRNAAVRVRKQLVQFQPELPSLVKVDYVFPRNTPAR